jgi:hypothetical protein
VGFVEERSLGSSMVGDFGKETSHTQPACKFQALPDHGNQPEGLLYHLLLL